MIAITDPDIIHAELVILKAKEEELMLEIEEVRANIGMHENTIEMMDNEYE